MTEELVRRYAKVLDELGNTTEWERTERAGLLAYLSRSDLTLSDITAKIEQYSTYVEAGKSEADYARHPELKWIIYLAAFEKKGTILGKMSPERAVGLVKSERPAQPPKDTKFVYQ